MQETRKCLPREAERYTSGAAGSGSAADAGGSRLHALVRQGPASCAPEPVCPARLLDHLVRQEEERRGERNPERLRGLAVEDQLELRGPLYGQVPRLSTL